MFIDNNPVPLSSVVPGMTFRFPADDRVFLRVDGNPTTGVSAYVSLADGLVVYGASSDGVILQSYKAVPVS